MNFGALFLAAEAAHAAGIEVHAGHGLVYETATLVAAIPQMVELNIGHFLMGECHDPWPAICD